MNLAKEGSKMLGTSLARIIVIELDHDLPATRRSAEFRGDARAGASGSEERGYLPSD
jgi:hypothetical protein